MKSKDSMLTTLICSVCLWNVCLGVRDAPQLVGALDAYKIKSFLGEELQVIAQSICCYPDNKACAGSLARSRLRLSAS